jgi:formylglycine-generating enzyme required for sulfatase activity
MQQLVMGDAGDRLSTVRLFFSYSHRDQDLRNELEKHLAALKRAKLIAIWHDRLIEPGKEWAKEIGSQLNTADIILLLVSADFINSECCWGVELERALARHDAGEARVIPVILRPCDWETTPFARIQVLPRDALPVSDWPSADKAFADVARGVRLVAEDLSQAKAAVAKKKPVRRRAASPRGARKSTRKAAAASAGVGLSVVEPAGVERGQGLQPGGIRNNAIDGQPYVWIPPGEFLMGAPDTDREADEDEKPQHVVIITKGFWLGQTPVTVAAYKQFAKATNREMPGAPNFNPGWRYEDRPIVNLTWSEAAAYCEWAGGRLPTEAEWEYAARAGSTAPRYGDLDQVAWYWDNSGGKTRPVGGKLPNAWRLYDALGNVWEWVADWYQKDYNPRPVSSVSDPKGPIDGSGTSPLFEHAHVLRGGSWFNDPRYVRVSNRFRYAPETRFDHIGFRCAWEVSP